VISAVLKRCPFQRKSLQAFLEQGDELFWTRAEDGTALLTGFLESCGSSLEAAVDAYAGLCNMMLVEQLKFAETGRYGATDEKLAHQQLYRSFEEMTPYMVGLAFSTFLWPNHYAIFDHLLTTLQAKKVGRYLEIGTGHGLFLYNALKLQTAADYTAIDISPVSIDMTRRFLDFALPDAKCRFEVCDLHEYSAEPADLVVMGEVLEHLEDPSRALRHVRGLIAPEGRYFLTTCANCPAIDHVYLYHDAEHIRQELREAGYVIGEDRVLPIENIPSRGGRAAPLGVNYSAVLERTK